MVEPEDIANTVAAPGSDGGRYLTEMPLPGDAGPVPKR